MRLRGQWQDLTQKICHFAERHQRRELRRQVPQFWRDGILAVNSAETVLEPQVRHGHALNRRTRMGTLPKTDRKVDV